MEPGRKDDAAYLRGFREAVEFVDASGTPAFPCNPFIEGTAEHDDYFEGQCDGFAHCDGE